MLNWFSVDNLLLECAFDEQSENVQNAAVSAQFAFANPFLEYHNLPLNQMLPQSPFNSQEYTDQIARKREESASKVEQISGKKDRHSKICTANGVRDRRMRLSVEVARKFFDLQDMLGHDKASKTIDWLLNQSIKAIQDLKEDLQPSNLEGKSTESECEERVPVAVVQQKSKKKRVVCKKARKRACKKDLKELREKARARARCRTREKMLIKEQMSKSSSISFEETDQESQRSVYSYKTDVGTIEKLLGKTTATTSTLCPSFSSFGYLPSTADSHFQKLVENWEVLEIDKQFEFADQSVYLAFP